VDTLDVGDESATVAQKKNIRRVRSAAVDVSGSWNVVGTIKPELGLPLRIHLPGLGGAKAERYLNFTSLAGWGVAANEMVSSFMTFAHGHEVKVIDSYHHIIREFLNFLYDMSGGRPPGEWTTAEWSRFTNSFILSVKRDVKRAASTKNRIRNLVVSFLSQLRDEGVAPPFPVVEGVDVITVGKKLAIGHVQRLDLSLDELSISDQALLAELDSLNDSAKPELLERRNAILTKRLRMHAERHARLHWEKFLEAEKIVADAGGFDAESFLDQFAISVEPLILRDGWMSEVGTPEAALKLAARLGPRILARADLESPLYRSLSRKMKVRDLRNMLFPGPETLLPFAILILLDLDNEPSSVLRMKVGCSQLTDDGTAVAIDWKKRRAGIYENQEAIRSVGSETCFDINSTEDIGAYQCVKRLVQMRERMKFHVLDVNSDDLFITYMRLDKPRASSRMYDQTATRHFRAFRDADPILRLFPFTMDELRSTAMEQTYVQTGGDIFKVQRRARHKNLRTTQIYVQGKAGDILDSRKVRDLHDLMVVTATRERKDLQDKLNIDQDRATELAKAAANAGMFGWKLSDSVAEPEDRLSDFVRWMIGREHVLFETPETAAEIIAFESHLRSEAETLRENPTWETTWVYLLLYLNAAIAEMRPDIRRAGQELADQYQITYAEVS